MKEDCNKIFINMKKVISAVIKKEAMNLENRLCKENELKNKEKNISKNILFMEALNGRINK